MKNIVININSLFEFNSTSLNVLVNYCISTLIQIQAFLIQFVMSHKLIPVVCVCIIGKSRPVSQHAPWWHRAWQQASRVSRVAWQQHVSTATTTALPTTEKDIRQCLVAV